MSTYALKFAADCVTLGLGAFLGGPTGVPVEVDVHVEASDEDSAHAPVELI